MTLNSLIILTNLSVGFLLIGCTSSEKNNPSDKWYNETKSEILKQSNLKSDSTISTFNEDSTFRKEHYYSGGQEFLLKGYNNGSLRLETHYSRDKNFELRREICENGNLGFEGIVFKEFFYGLSTWKNCKGQLEQQGIRYKDQKIGVWKKWDEGKLKEEKDYKNLAKLDSMPIIMK